MQALVVRAHPRPDSFNRALFETSIDSLRAGGHEVRAVDLCSEDFQPAMSRAERVAYHSGNPIISPDVARHARLVREAEMLVFVYPTVSFGLPAVLNGWLERVLVPGVGFVFDPRTSRVKPHLLGVRRIIGISTYCATWGYTKSFNDAGRRTLTRALRLGCARRARVTWLALYDVHESTQRQRADFLGRVERKLSTV